MPAGNAYLTGKLVLSSFLGLACDPIVETRFPEIAMSLLLLYITFHLEYPIVLSRFCPLIYQQIVTHYTQYKNMCKPLPKY